MEQRALAPPALDERARRRRSASLTHDSARIASLLADHRTRRPLADRAGSPTFSARDRLHEPMR